MRFSIIRVFAGMTVRARIIVLAAIPLAGFLANGTAFTTGQAEVEEAFDSVKRAAALAGNRGSGQCSATRAACPMRGRPNCAGSLCRFRSHPAHPTRPTHLYSCVRPIPVAC